MSETVEDSWPRVVDTKRIVIWPDDGHCEHGLSFIGDQLTINDYRAIGNKRTFTVSRPVEVYTATYADGQVFVAEYLERPVTNQLVINIGQLKFMSKLVASNGKLSLTDINNELPGVDIMFLSKRRVIMSNFAHRVSKGL
jgi:hypothetical protein